MADRSGSDTSGYWQRLRQARSSRRRVLAGGVTVLTGGIAVGLIGCGSSSKNDNTNSNTGGAATQAATTAATATKAPSATSGSASSTANPAAGTPAAPWATSAKTGGPARHPQRGGRS